MNKYDILAEKIRASRQNIREALQGEYVRRDTMFSDLVSQKEQEQKALQELIDRPARKIEDVKSETKDVVDDIIGDDDVVEEKKADVVDDDEINDILSMMEDLSVDFNRVDLTNKVSLKDKVKGDLYTRKKNLDNGSVSITIYEKLTPRGNTKTNKDLAIGNLLTSEDGYLFIETIEELDTLGQLIPLIKNRKSKKYLIERIETATSRLTEKRIEGKGIEDELKLLLGSYLAKNNSPRLMNKINDILVKLTKNNVVGGLDIELKPHQLIMELLKNKMF